MAATGPSFTVKKVALILCRVSNTLGVVGVDRKSHAERISDEVFSNRFGETDL